MNLYLVRHGLTPWNLAGRLQGWTDVDLTLEGLDQAEKTAEFFADFKARRRLRISAIYTSPLRRACLTATIIGEALHLGPIGMPDLREMRGGLIEGLQRDEWQRLYPDLVKGWQDRANLDFGWPGGETRRAFRGRVLRAMAEVVAEHKAGDNVIVVTHGGVIKAFLTAAQLDDPLGPRAYDAANCSITHVQLTVDDYENTSSQIWSVGCVRAFNQVGHLHEDVADHAAVANADLALV